MWIPIHTKTAYCILFNSSKPSSSTNLSLKENDELYNDKEDYVNSGIKFSHLSLDSNHLESQSEWSDDGREEATGNFS